MTLSRSFGSLPQKRIANSAAALFSHSAIYRFCIAFAVFDFLDIFDFLDSSSFNMPFKYCYAAIILGLMFVYVLKWKTIDTTSLAPIISLLFFFVMGLAFALNFLIYDQRQSYISAFVAALVFSLSIVIPQNAIMLDARRITRDLTLLFSVGAVFYLVEAIVKPLDLVKNLVFLNEVQFLKSINCVLALSICILTGRKTLALFLAVVTVIALILRPTSTLVLALICCLPLAVALRLRVLSLRPVAVSLSRAAAMTIWALAVIIPLLLYFFLDEIGPVINSVESYLKVDVLGGQSNTSFRLAIMKYAFASFDNTSFLYGSALSGDLSVLIAQQFDWWINQNPNGLVSIHSDFVIVLVLMGIIGYAFLSAMFFLMLKTRFRELVRFGVHGNGVVLHSISIIAVVALIVYCSVEPFLSYYNHAHVVWMLLLISEVARKTQIAAHSPIIRRS